MQDSKAELERQRGAWAPEEAGADPLVDQGAPGVAGAGPAPATLQDTHRHTPETPQSPPAQPKPPTPNPTDVEKHSILGGLTPHPPTPF